MTTEAPPCRPGKAHYYIVETAHGPKSPGICKWCKRKKEFNNSFERLSWMETRGTMYTGPVEATLYPRKVDKLPHGE